MTPEECAYCNFPHRHWYGDKLKVTDWHIYHDKHKYVLCGENDRDAGICTTEIDYCPMCGRRLVNG